jgi:integrase
LQTKTITRRRQKTGIKMTWNLWDETAMLLQKYMACQGDLALITDGGQPLVWYSPKGHRVDVIPNRWARLVKQAKGVDETFAHKPFKTLRKTGATMMRAIGGIEVSEIYLAHSEKTVARYYSTPSQGQLTTALRAMRIRLAPMFKTPRTLPTKSKP